MSRIKVILFFVIVLLFFLVATFFYGRYQGKQLGATENKPAIVNSQAVLERITNQYFLVTKTVLVNSKTEIDTPKNNNWTDLFTGKKITVYGLIRVDVGVDMKNMRLDNIVVDSKNKIVTITLPHAEILDSSLSGELDVIADKSILEKIKGLFKNTQNEDYNMALKTLIESANNQVMGTESIFEEARNDSVKLVTLIVTSMLSDYQVVIR